MIKLRKWAKSNMDIEHATRIHNKKFRNVVFYVAWKNMYKNTTNQKSPIAVETRIW